MASGPTTSTITASRYALAGQHSPTPDTVTASAFRQWPAGVQAAFVQSFATNKPPSILVGQPGAQQVIATLAPGGGDVEVTQAPVAINQRPSDLNVYEFQNWPSEAQILYTQTNGSGEPASVEIGTFGASLTATVTNDALGTAVGVALTSSAGLTSRYGTTLDKGPAALDPTEFFSLLPDEQFAYAVKNSGSAPPSIALGNPGANATAITLSSNGRTYVVTVAADKYPGFADKLTRQNSLVPNFTSWPREVQRAYVEAQSSGAADVYPKTVVVGLSNSITSIAAKGAEVDLVPIPNGFGSGFLPRPETFLSWPEAAQVAFARTRLGDLNQAAPLAFTAASGQTLNVGLSGAPPGITLASPVSQGVPPADLDLNLFQLWPPADQTLYLQSRGTGTPKALVVGSDTALLTAGANGRVEIDPFPTGFRLPPAYSNPPPNPLPDPPTILSPTTFLTWSPAFRALYAARNGAPDNAGGKSVAIGPPNQQITAAVSGGGNLSVSNDILRIEPTQGLGLANPTLNIYGSDIGLSTEPNRTNAETLFPTLTGEAGRTIVDKPADVAAQFAKGPASLTAAEFGKWNSVVQLEYLRREGAGKPGYAVTIGSGTDTITAFIAASGTKVFTVEGLQKTDIAKMALADQTVLAGLPAFTGGLATTLGLIANKAAALQFVTDGIDKVTAPGANGVKGGDSGMPEADKKVFLDQLAILRKKIDNGAIFSVKDIQDQIADITNRFERANCFAVPLYQSGSTAYVQPIYVAPFVTFTGVNGNSVPGILVANNRPNFDLGFIAVGGKYLKDLITLPPPGFNGTYTYEFKPPITYDGVQYKQITFPANTQNAVSTDGNQGIKAGYDTFMAQERQLLNLSNSRQNLAETGRIATQNLDVPNLVYLFQLYSNLAGEAKIRADTEEINQTNAVLKTYAVLQNLINSTVKSFDPENTGDSHGLKGSGPDGSLTVDEQTVRNMFDKNNGASGIKNPIEALKGLSRPVDDFADRKMTQWQTYGQQLSDAVTLINQESQIKMNDVNSQTKAKDRNFDLANNALSKMNEIVQKIANAA